jgi:hypothetical protein
MMLRAWVRTMSLIVEMVSFVGENAVVTIATLNSRFDRSSGSAGLLPRRGTCFDHNATPGGRVKANGREPR